MMMVSFWLLYFSQFTVNGVVTSNSFCTIKHLTNKKKKRLSFVIMFLHIDILISLGVCSMEGQLY